MFRFKLMLVHGLFLGIIIGLCLLVIHRFEKARDFKNQNIDSEISISECFISLQSCCSQVCLEKNNDCMETNNRSFCKNELKICILSCDNI